MAGLPKGHRNGWSRDYQSRTLPPKPDWSDRPDPYLSTVQYINVTVDLGWAENRNVPAIHPMWLARGVDGRHIPICIWSFNHRGNHSPFPVRLGSTTSRFLHCPVDRTSTSGYKWLMLVTPEVVPPDQRCNSTCKSWPTSTTIG